MVRGFVFKYWKVAVIATAIAFLLGAVTSLLGVATGPALKVFLSGKMSGDLAIVQLLGPHVGGVVAGLVGRESVAVAAFLAVLPGALICVAITKALLTLAQWYLWERISEYIAYDLRADILKRYLKLRPDATEIHDRTTSCLTTDVKMVREYVVHWYGGLPREGLQVIFLLGVLVALSPYLFVVFCLGVLPFAVVVDRIGRSLRKRSSRALNDFSVLTEWLQLRLRGVETIKHLRTEEFEIEGMKRLNSRMYNGFLRAARMKARTSPMLELTVIVAIGIVLWMALSEKTAQSIDGSVYLSFFATLGWLSQSAGKLGKYLNSNREGAAAISRIRDLMDELDAREVSKVMPEIEREDENSLIFDKIDFGYEPERKLLNDCSYSFTGGKMYALAGASGLGKSALVKVALGLERAQGGSISWRGSPHKVPILYLQQEPKLVPATVAQNLLYPVVDDGKDRGGLEQALERAGASSFVKTLPEGLETKVGVGYASLSGGEAQRLMLARAFYWKSPFIFIDEGTSALDPSAEAKALKEIARLAHEGSLVISIAHRPAALEAADRCLSISPSGQLVSIDPGSLAGSSGA